MRLGPSDRALIEQHERRFDGFAQPAIPIADLRGTPFWSEWEKQVAIRQELVARESQLDEQLASHASADLAQAELYRDLQNLYERTKAEVRIPMPGGRDRPFIASRLKQAIDRGRRESTLVPVVARIVKDKSGGFQHLANARRPDLMIETLVLDETKTYHRLFVDKTKLQARANLNAYYEQHPDDGPLQRSE